MIMQKSQVLGWWWTSKVILNPMSFGQSNVGTVSSDEIIARVRCDASNLKSKFISDDGLKVNYEMMGKSEDLLKYEDTVSMLQRINLDAMHEVQRRSFYVNVYNSLVTHSIARSKLTSRTATAQLGRLQFYATYSYVIGNHAYCLNDIENGLLRGNRQSPVPLTSPPFSAGDARAAFCVSCDPRIHFALNCGAKSCPPFVVYSPEAEVFDRQLAIATELFLDSTATVQYTAQHVVINLSKIFDWYLVDFGSSDTQVVQWIHDHAGSTLQAALQQALHSGKPLKLMYSPYDWNLNS